MTVTVSAGLSSIGLRWYETGQAGLSGPLLRLAEECDRAFRTLSSVWEAAEERHPSALPARCHRTWRPDGHTALKDSADLRLSSYHSAHFIEFGMAAGYHGIRWEWD